MGFSIPSLHDLFGIHDVKCNGVAFCRLGPGHDARFVAVCTASISCTICDDLARMQKESLRRALVITGDNGSGKSSIGYVVLNERADILPLQVGFRALVHFL